MPAKPELVMRKLKIARGQLDGVIRMLEEGRYCIDVSNQIMAVTQALKAVNRDVLEGHLHSCVKDSLANKDVTDIEQKLDEISKVIEKLSK